MQTSLRGKAEFGRERRRGRAHERIRAGDRFPVAAVVHDIDVET